MCTTSHQSQVTIWKEIPWSKIERNVFKLQSRIFKASQEGQLKTVRQLQKTLLNSWSAKCLAVRRVTQDNQGKKTAGVDGIKSLSPNHRLDLLNVLKLPLKGKPTRRIWIPKTGSLEKRPLGIPTINDRALQALVKQALEPEWEAKFESSSYGFRPGRSAHDAIAAIFNSISHKAKYVLDADIAQCFDRINHEALLTKINTFPTLKWQLKSWLKAGVMDEDTLFPTSEGTPQGGIISPLLANIALDGLETWIKKEVPVKQLRDNRSLRSTPIHFVRYADDFVFIHEDLAVVQQCKRQVANWLSTMGLVLKDSKTRITHTLFKHEDNVGFNFLGFNIRQFTKLCHQVGAIYKSPHLTTIIRPSKESINRHYRYVSWTIDHHKGSDQTVLVNKLNPIIRGWCMYYSRVVSKQCFSRLDHLLFTKLSTWAKRRHSTKSTYWVCNKYWQIDESKRWHFGVRSNDSNTFLHHYSTTQIVRHIKIQCGRSPYDGDWLYWSIRMGRSLQINKRMAILLKKQQGKCAHCRLFFGNDDRIEVDHIVPRSRGGKDVLINLQLLHRHCHDLKTASDWSSQNSELTDAAF